MPVQLFIAVKKQKKNEKQDPNRLCTVKMDILYGPCVKGITFLYIIFLVCKKYGLYGAFVYKLFVAMKKVSAIFIVF